MFCFKGFSQNFAVEFKMKPQKNRSVAMSEDVAIKSLSRKHNGVLRQSYPNARNPELLLYYTLTGSGNKEGVVQDYLQTEKFEKEVREFEKVYPASCSNPVLVNDTRRLETGNSYPLNMIEASCAWTITKGNSNILIGVADTEFLTTHEDLKNKFASVNGPTPVDIYYHGSFTASIAAAETNNDKGIASIGYKSKIAGYTIDYLSPHHTPSDIRDAIWSLYQMGIPIINVSWSGTGGLARAAAEEITQNGTTLVLSGGNSTTSTSHNEIANTPGVIVVSSVNINNMHGPTNHAHNQWIDICAPGVDVLVAGGNNTGYFEETGTSVAAPFVSGTVALMLSLDPNLTPANIEQIIKSTADPIADGSSYAGLLGAGRLNAYKAVQAVSCVSENIYNRNVTTNLDVTNCKVNIQNVTVQNNAKLSVSATKGTTIPRSFKVQPGSTLEVK